MKQRINIYYSGRVQGVGFRFTAIDIASELDVTGWVKNLHDGRVEVVAEGEERLLREFLDKIQQQMGRYVRDVDINWLEYQGEFREFDIRF